MRLNNSKQHGFTFTLAALVIVMLMIAGIAFLMYVFNIGKATRKVESSAVARYTAEIGITNLKAQLAKLNVPIAGVIENQWFQAKTMDNSGCLFPSAQPCGGVSRSALNTDRTSNYILLYDSLDTTTRKVVGSYRVTIEDGVLVSGKTSTGSTTAGLDSYQNQIWSNATDKNLFKTEDEFRYGVKIEGYSADKIDGAGVPVANASGQIVYSIVAVPKSSTIIMPGEWTTGAPVSYLLSTNGVDPNDSTKKLILYNNQVITGPVHTNDKMDFYWRGLFDVNNLPKSKYNDDYTFSTQRTTAGGYSGDVRPPAISRVVRMPGQTTSPNKITIFGQNFSNVNGNNWISFDNGSNWINPVSTTVLSVGPPVQVSMSINVPVSATSPYSISAGVAGASCTYRTEEGQIPDVPLGYVPESTASPIGIMQVSKGGMGIETIYKQGFKKVPPDLSFDDYSLCKNGNDPVCSAIIDPYIFWSSGGTRPNLGDVYEITYITPYNFPHRKTYIYDQLSQSLNLASYPPLKYYEHSHKASQTNILYPYASPHDHRGNVFGDIGINLDINALTPDYDMYAYPSWWTTHRHTISGLDTTTRTNTMQEANSFFYWLNNNYKPVNISAKVAPVLAPNNVNYYKQREYANFIFKLILGKQLSRDGSGNLESPSVIPADNEKGYYVGDVDFRRTYFGNDLKYSAGPNSGILVLPTGSKITDTALIYVNDKQYANDNPTTPNADYLRVADTQLTTDYRQYIYRQIPKNSITITVDDPTTTPNEGGKVLNDGIIFVREGTVRIGGAGHWKGNIANTSSSYLASNTLAGRSTIIDGRLTIIAYSEVKPTAYIDNDANTSTDNKGDIVITGNIIYKNKVYPNVEHVTNRNDSTSDISYIPGGFRQYDYRVQNTFDKLSYKNNTVLTTNNPYHLYDLTPPLPTPPTPPPIAWGINPPGGLGYSGWITDRKGNLEPSLPTGIMSNSLALVASNDIKIPVMQYHQDSSEVSFDSTTSQPCNSSGSGLAPKHDRLFINGELIAGHQITQTKAGASNNAVSKNDQLIMYGSFYSDLPPNLSYFDRDNDKKVCRNEESMGRIYLFDKSLSAMPLAGTPYFPIDSTYSPDKILIVGTQLPRILPGTWKNLN